MIKGRSVVLRSASGWSIAALLGTSGILLLLIPGFPNLAAAQITAGIIGLAGGLSYASLLGAIGGRISRKHSLYLSVSWALSLIGGITSVFLVSGPSPKIAVLTFYSFAAWGTVGGFVTARILRHLFPETLTADPLPPLAVWSMSLGMAAVAADAVGETAKAFLPDWLAWVLAFELMGLMIGLAGGYAVRQLFKPRPGQEVAVGKGIPAADQEGDRMLRPTVLLLLCLPFYLNDFTDIHIRDWRLWLFIDYTGVRLFPLLVISWLIGTGKMRPAEVGLTTVPAISFLSVFLIGTLVGVFLEQNGNTIISGLPGYQALGEMPGITSPFWHWLDLTAGLLMVGISEELVFRGYLGTFLSRYTRHAVVIVAISALAFGLIHWSGGLHKVLVTAAVGAVFMALYLKTRALQPLILSHFAVNFIAFADIIPKSIFRFF